MLSEKEKVVHLLNRTGFGPRPGDVERILQTGWKQHIEEQLHPERIDDAEIDKWDPAFDTLTMDTATLRSKYQNQRNTILNQLQAYKVMRAIHSKRQLHEAMVDFWFNHFNVFWAKEDVQFLATSYERNVIRPNALGKFKDLLLATAKHPAMLIYLDNALSSRERGINENYARELMELHTLGVDGGYTQRDIEEVARCFTGWTVDREQQSMAFTFQPLLHEPGTKTVLGRQIPSGDYAEGEAVINLLAKHPNTARFIAMKLVRRFVSDDPPQSLIQRVAKVFADTDGDIREMVRTVLNSEELFEPGSYRAKVKSPFEVVVSSVRAVDAEIRVPLAAGRTTTIVTTNGQVTITTTGTTFAIFQGGGRMSGLSPDVQAYMSLVQSMESMGQFLYRYEPPTGYPDRGDYWLNAVTVLNRMNFAVSLVENEVAGIFVDPARLQKLLPDATESDGSWRTALDLVTVASASPNPGSEPGSSRSVRDFGLALGSPEFQHK